MTTPPGYVELLQCPYEKAHRIQAPAMSKHLFKCRKNHQNLKFVSCPFNESHRVPGPELKLHTKQCTDRATFESYKYCISSQPANVPPKETTAPELVYNNSPPKEPFDKTRSVKSKEQPILPPPGLRDDDDDECWDDMNIPPYNPQTYCATAKVIRKATLKKPSEKKAFYESERLRLQDLKLND